MTCDVDSDCKKPPELTGGFYLTVLFCICLDDRPGELIRTGCILKAAGDSAQLLFDIPDLHSVNYCGNSLEVSVTASREFYVPNNVAVKVKCDAG